MVGRIPPIQDVLENSSIPSETIAMGFILRIKNRSKILSPLVFDENIPQVTKRCAAQHVYPLPIESCFTVVVSTIISAIFHFNDSFVELGLGRIIHVVILDSIFLILNPFLLSIGHLNKWIRADTIKILFNQLPKV